MAAAESAVRVESPNPTPSLPPGPLPSGPLEPEREIARAGEFATALAKAQGEFEPIKRSREVQVTMRSGGQYTFRYAPLDGILAAVLPALNRNGFALTQQLVKGTHGDYVETTLIHASGSRSNKFPIFVTDTITAQVYGSGVTYARRYGVTLLLAVAAEDDEDGNQADGNTIHASRNVEESENPAPQTTRAELAKFVKGGKGKTPNKGRVVTLEPGVKPLAPPKPVAPAIKPANTSPPAQLALDGGELQEPEGDAQVKAEGRIADAIQELVEAASEGRAVGIRQIWEEIKTDEYVATMTWKRLKDGYPDQFAVVSGVLQPKDSTPRGKRGERG